MAKIEARGRQAFIYLFIKQLGSSSSQVKSSQKGEVYE